MGIAEWCPVCCSLHAVGRRCPDTIAASGPERRSIRVEVHTPRGVESFDVLVARTGEVWRARILTYPDILRHVPRRSGAFKFVGTSACDAERKAEAFIRRHCGEHDFAIRGKLLRAESGCSLGRRSSGAIETIAATTPSPRKNRFLPIRFGLDAPCERAGTGNLSETGMFLITDNPIEVGCRVRMLLGLRSRHVPLAGDVRWRRSGNRAGRWPGMGVRLSDPPPGYLELVRALP